MVKLLNFTESSGQLLVHDRVFSATFAFVEFN